MLFYGFLSFRSNSNSIRISFKYVANKWIYEKFYWDFLNKLFKDAIKLSFGDRFQLKKDIHNVCKNSIEFYRSIPDIILFMLNILRFYVEFMILLFYSVLIVKKIQFLNFRDLNGLIWKLWEFPKILWTKWNFKECKFLKVKIIKWNTSPHCL